MRLAEYGRVSNR